jgi:hypothetical protein
VQSLAVVIALCSVAIFAVQLGLSSWYAGKMYPGVAVANVPLGGLNQVDARKKLLEKLKDYKVSLAAGGQQFTTAPEQAGVNYDIEATLQQAYVTGHGNWLAPLGLYRSLHEGKLQFAYSVNRDQEQRFVQSVVDKVGTAPVDASIVVENGVPKPKQDVNGVGLSTEQVVEALNRQIANVDPSVVPLTTSSQVARIRAADLAPAIEQTKQLLSVPVVITYQGKTFHPTPADMGEWVSYDKAAPDQPAGLTPKVNLDGIKHYLQGVSKQVNVNPVNKKITIENGVSRVDREGSEGLSLNQDALADQIGKAFMAKEALAVEAPMQTVAFQTEYNKVVTLAFGKYIEVNLSQQHLWVYQDHQVIFESPITSGATGAGYPTVQGLFSIQAKQTNRNLNGYAIGYNYNVFVKYWMPFYADYGLHDASWRSNFGGQDYYYGGSHGCVNLPDATAAFLYGWADVGTPVWVHS